MKRPRVIHVYKDVYPPVEGGIERTIYHLARMTRGEFDPAVVVASGDGVPRVRSLESGVEGVDGIEVFEVRSFGRVLSTPIAPGFVDALRRSRADLFHFHFPHPTGEVAYLASRLATPAVVTYHSDIVRQEGALRLYRPLMDRFLAKMRVIMPTTRRYMETSALLAPHLDRCRPVALGLPLEDYEPDAAASEMASSFRERWGDYVLFLGVLRAYKGLHFLIEALADLPRTRLVIAGDGPERSHLEALVRESGLAGRVDFMGRVDQTTAVALFNSASIFCLPAHQRSEAFGLCQIEAMACGLPVISTDLPTGVPEVNRDGESGLIVPPGNSRALGKAIEKLETDVELRRKLGQGARLRARNNFTARRMADEVAKVYREVLGTGSK